MLEHSDIHNPENEMNDSGLSQPDVRTALVIGHPGHELMVHGWLETTQPRVFVFTDGSGRSNRSRLGSTTTVLNQAGAKGSEIYGRLTDAEAYEAILNHDFDLFLGLARELCEAFAAERIDCVAGDAFEGYNPVHVWLDSRPYPGYDSDCVANPGSDLDSHYDCGRVASIRRYVDPVLEQSCSASFLFRQVKKRLRERLQICFCCLWLSSSVSP